MMGTKLRTFFRLNNLQYKQKFYLASSAILTWPQSKHTWTNYNQDHSEYKSSSRSYFYHGCFIASGLVGLAGYAYLKKVVVFADGENVTSTPAGQVIDNLPFYQLNDVAEHASKEKKIWVTYKNGVYDVTDFIDKHPGGNKILLAAGGSVEPFWLLYGMHNNPEVQLMLEEYRIGNLRVEDVRQYKSETSEADPYSKDPQRHPALKPASVKPFNAEPPLSLLVDNFITPVEIFYVRNHLPVPEVDEKKYKLKISGTGIKETSLSLDEIKKFPKHTVVAAIQCAGNRRSEMVQVKPVKGLNWGPAAIGNGTWTGARLVDVLKHCGLKGNETSIEHVQFEGLDTGPENVPYGASIPADKALDPKGEVILAYEMNGKPLSRDHGFPIRAVVPGVVGARNVKWLGKIVLSNKESDSHWQQNDYKGFSPSTDWDTVDFKTAPAIQELPVISAICSPEQGDSVELSEGMLIVKGYAWSGGGRNIVRVDVSTDYGKTWHVADLEQNSVKTSRHWAWTLWTAAIPVNQEVGKVEVWAKAVDSSYNTQPESFENIWNLRGVLSNAYHKVQINVIKS